CPKETVRGEMWRYLFKFSKWLDDLDGRIAATANADDANALGIAGIAFVVGNFIQIHPFLNGNGRVSRLLASFLLLRFGMPPMQEYPRPPDDAYESVNAAAMVGDFGPLIEYILKSAYPK